MNTRISKVSQGILIISAVLLATTIFVPIWRIELQAPQYPEGLVLKIHAGKIGGNVDIINGLNHYIGMQTLHEKNFIEFTVLPYLIGLIALLMIIAFAKSTRKWYTVALAGLAIFGIVAMVDFWRWEYNYGHNLDPNAAIVVPGMAYQPPLIGFKQLLNFGAYSTPDTGGWLFVAAGLLLLTGFVIDYRAAKKKRAKAGYVAAICAGLLALSSCISKEPQPIAFDSDKCEYCKMVISDARFPAEMLTQKGRIYKFDDLHCMQEFYTASGIPVSVFFATDYNGKSFFNAATGYYVKQDSVKSPMGGNILAFSEKKSAERFGEMVNKPVTGWMLVTKK